MGVKTSLSLCLLFVFSSLGFSQDTHDMKDLLNMSISELLNVSVASTKTENIAHTPAVVSRYEASDMSHLGLRSLKDMLSFIPGFVVQTSEIGTVSIMIRGFVESFNQKVLFLLDGVPYWQSSHGDNALLGIAFEHISRVEVIRGPGAVIYGTNATGGVVNVITKLGHENQVSFAVGSNNQMRGSAYLSGDWGTIGHLSLMASFKRDQGYDGFFNTRNPPGFYPQDTPLEGNIKRYDEHDSLYLRFKNDRLKAGLHVFGSDASGLAAAASIVNEAVLKYRGYLATVDYQVQTDSNHFRVFGDYNNFYLAIPTNALFSGREPGVQEMSANGNDNYRARIGLRNEYSINDKVHWLVGVEGERRASGEYGNTPDNDDFNRIVTMTPQELDESSLYTQLDFSTGMWRILVGGRYVDNERAGSDFNPRGSLIYKTSARSSVKLLYATGFNSPNFIQQAITIPFVLAGDPTITAEKVVTIDLAYTYIDDDQLFVANAYRTEAEDFIRRVPNPNAGGSLFQNADNFERHGIEIDYQRTIQKGRVFANVAWQKEANQVHADDGTALFAPQWRVSLGGHLGLQTRHRVGGSLIWLSEREAVDSQTGLNLSYHYGGSLVDAYVDLKNVLSETFMTPDIGNFGSNRLSPAGDPDLNFETGLKLRF